MKVPPNRRRPLTGLRVVELGDHVSAPYCGQILADLGAEVIKVEPPRIGDSSRYYPPFVRDEPSPDTGAMFQLLNRNKLGVTLDIGTLSGQELLGHLVSGSDIAVWNRSAEERWGSPVDGASLIRANAGLIAVGLSPFGASGPRSAWRAADINVAAATGYSLATGSPGRQPLGFPVPVASMNAGLYAACAVMAALGTSASTGAGTVLDISEVESFEAGHTGMDVLRHAYGFPDMAARGRQAAGTDGFLSVNLACKDGYAHVGAVLPGQRERLVAWIKAAGYRQKAQDAVGEDSWEDFEKLVGDWLTEQTRSDVLRLELDQHFGVYPVRTVDDVVNAETTRSMFCDLEIAPETTLRLPELPVRSTSWAAPAPKAAPRLGEHNTYVWGELVGVSRLDLVDLFATGVI
jgi:crotonobetainyl-CoA:carnitine CoA-transferase CaiB-like acyl-CoA transferase